MKTFKSHFPEYLMEGLLLGLFMVSAIGVTAILEHPDSPLHKLIPDPLVRRTMTGVAMGLTAIGLIYSPWGRRSGAHMNPAVTLTFFCLGKIRPWDALFYMLAQFMGGAAGVILVHGALGSRAEHPAVNFAVTVPGVWGAGAAFMAEAFIAGLLMLTVLIVSSRPRLAPYTAIFPGLLVAIYITVEAPVSGMSMNPARTTASALSASVWKDVWIYFSAPPLGMLAAAGLFTLFKSVRPVACAKLVHDPAFRCIFCGHQPIAELLQKK